MTVIVAVSGGVDSVVLLDMLVQRAEQEVVVAHFDHGIRPDSAADARFVQALAEQYGLACEVRREELGPKASEALARQRRYEFLQIVAQKYGGIVATAHHANDVVETIAINLSRGTGWRGLACLNDPNLIRPLLTVGKQQLYDYARRAQLEWVEDETNATDVYLRNTLRRKLASLTKTAHSDILKLHQHQVKVGSEIDNQTERIIKQVGAGSRYFFTNISDPTAIELLRAVLMIQDSSLTRPGRQRLLQAIKTARSGTTIQLGDGITSSFTQKEFTIKTTGEML